MSQPKLHWSAYLWPGLPHLWARGSWAGLALAVGFTVLLNVWIAATLVWNEWMPPEVKTVGAGLLATLWVLAWVEGRADWRRYLAELGERDGLDPSERSELRYKEAQQKYLAGDWVATEQLLLKILKQEKQDVSAALMLATLWRRQDRPQDACQELDKIEKWEAAAPWQAEIAAERRLLSKGPDEIRQEIEVVEEVTIEIESEEDETETPTILPLHGLEEQLEEQHLDKQDLESPTTERPFENRNVA
ncbi:tetratricopeptide repeat protein [Adhaeretor mobilis]|uniref:Uncharacterized protein n=1 Tax=Adhaeretor mobilis TaxID=1930276 RepID=A0A517N218_9BACT|nr:hypothetical protein [Adhaeretor mobilis]QDT01171.1 hypothetical protein HG15A2_45130 [Adhaeretor mobilis]